MYTGKVSSLRLERLTVVSYKVLMYDKYGTKDTNTKGCVRTGASGCAIADHCVIQGQRSVPCRKCLRLTYEEIVRNTTRDERLARPRRRIEL